MLIDAPIKPGYRHYHALTAAANDTDPHVELADHNPYNIIYSSGTTGLPKGIVHTHYIRACTATLFAAAFGMTPGSVVLHAGSLVFNGAFVTL